MWWGSTVGTVPTLLEVSGIAVIAALKTSWLEVGRPGAFGTAVTRNAVIR
jgi:hypothetical protein